MRQFRNRSIQELLDRGRQVLRIQLERLGAVPSPRAPAGIRLQPTLPWAPLAQADLEAVYDQRPAERARLVAEADAALEGRHHLLGFTSLEFGRPINWHLDPTRGRQAPSGHWSQVPYLDESVVGDHKIVWEMNRHQWLVTVAQAWRLTGDPRYLEHIAETLDRWLLANPPRMGINWASSLELAFRSIAWSWILHFTAGSLPDHRNLHHRLLDSLVAHGIQIERHLSTWFSPNTHLTGEALGLLYLGTGWPALPQAQRWRTLGWRILTAQLPVQVRPDGTYFEQASWYQGYTADFYLHALLLGRASGLPVGPGVEERVAAGVEVIAELLRPDGSLPLIGDDDGGRLLPLDVVRTDFRDTLALGRAVLVDRHCGPEREIPAATSWIVGADRWHDLAARTAQSPVPRSRAFAAGGCYLLRGRSGSMLVDAGPHGALSGGHSHADALALDLTVGGCAVVADPGTGAYVGPWRDAFRATVAHNTVSLAGGIGSAEPAGQFRWGRWPQVTVRHWSEGPGWAALEAEHDGFGRAVPGLVHRRTVVFRDGWGWLILDRLLGDGVEATVRFQFGPGLEATTTDGQVCVHLPGQSPLVWIVPDQGSTLEPTTGLVSTCYGVAHQAPGVFRRMTREASLAGVATLVATTAESRLEAGALPGEWMWRVKDSPEIARLEIGADGVTRFHTTALAVVFD